MAETKVLHVSEPFSLQTVVPAKAEGERATVSYRTFNRGDAVEDAGDIKLVEEAWKNGTIGHNHFRQVFVSTPEEPVDPDYSTVTPGVSSAPVAKAPASLPTEPAAPAPSSVKKG